MSILARRRKASNFQRASDGSMTLMEHLRELRTRLFRASLAIVVGMIGGYALSGWVRNLLNAPYCDITRQMAIKDNNGVEPANWQCQLVQLAPADGLLLTMKISLWVGLIIAAPIWMYQLWAFVAPGLHRTERRWAYLFAGIAAPLFALGAVLAYFVVATGLEFLLDFAGDNVTTTLSIVAYTDFITGLMVIFGVAFEFPLGVLIANVAGIVTGRRLLGWWRTAVFVCFAFAAVATPTADPFGMTFLALALSVLYFAAVGFALVNDRRRGRGKPVYGNVGDDEISPLDLTPEPVGASGPVDALAPVDAPEPVTKPLPIDSRYDDVT